MGKHSRQLNSQVIMTFLLVCLCPAAMADPIKDQLDHARGAFDAAAAKAATDLTSAFDAQIKAVSQTGNLDAVEQLRAQQSACKTITVRFSYVIRNYVHSDFTCG